jgi:hypothetical protein
LLETVLVFSARPPKAEGFDFQKAKRGNAALMFVLALHWLTSCGQ